MFERFSASTAALIAVPFMACAEPNKVEADFVGEGTYSPATGCTKLEDIKRGKAAPNIATYPMTLTRSGTRSWEGGCKFSTIREIKTGTFESKMVCSEGSEEYEEPVTFRRIDSDQIEVGSGTEKTIYLLCKGLEGTSDR